MSRVEAKLSSPRGVPLPNQQTYSNLIPINTASPSVSIVQPRCNHHGYVAAPWVVVGWSITLRSPLSVVHEEQGCPRLAVRSKDVWCSVGEWASRTLELTWGIRLVRPFVAAMQTRPSRVSLQGHKNRDLVARCGLRTSRAEAGVAVSTRQDARSIHH